MRKTVVDADPFVVGACACDNLSDGFLLLRMLPLFRNTEAALQIVRADQDGIDIRQAEDFIQALHRWDALDIDNQNMIRVSLRQIRFQFRLQRCPVEKSPESVALQGAVLHRTPWSLDLFN
jgi:hypothetical protein